MNTIITTQFYIPDTGSAVLKIINYDNYNINDVPFHCR